MKAVNIGQTVINGKLRWYRSSMGEDGIFEEDGIGMPPEWIRDYLIEKDGRWELIAIDATDKSVVVRLMRLEMKLEMAAAARLLKSLPGVIYTGTKVEVDWLRAKLLELDCPVETRCSK
jgi:hypothetical protein